MRTLTGTPERTHRGCKQTEEKNMEMKLAPAIQTTASWSAREHKLTTEDGTTYMVIILDDDNHYLPSPVGKRLTNPEDFKIECYHPTTCPVHRPYHG